MKADPWVERFLREVLPKLKRAVDPPLVILFGSRVEGSATEDSDLDVVVVSEAFRDVPFLKRMPMLLKLADFGIHIDFLCYTPEEFARLRDSSSVLIRALKKGIVIHGNGDQFIACEGDQRASLPLQNPHD